MRIICEIMRLVSRGWVREKVGKTDVPAGNYCGCENEAGFDDGIW